MHESPLIKSQIGKKSCHPQKRPSIGTVLRTDHYHSGPDKKKKKKRMPIKCLPQIIIYFFLEKAGPFQFWLSLVLASIKSKSSPIKTKPKCKNGLISYEKIHSKSTS